MLVLGRVFLKSGSRQQDSQIHKITNQVLHTWGYVMGSKDHDLVFAPGVVWCDNISLFNFEKGSLTVLTIVVVIKVWSITTTMVIC